MDRITKSLLMQAKELIVDPQHWTRQSYATTQDGEPVSLRSPNAACFCMVGAIGRAGGFSNGIHAADCLREFLGGYEHIVDLYEFNDHHTHEEVLAKMDELIANASEE